MNHSKSADQQKQLVQSAKTKTNGHVQEKKALMPINSQLMHLFFEELTEVFWLEKSLMKFIPSLIQKASSVSLIRTLSDHLDVTNLQVERLAKVFVSIDRRPRSVANGILESIMNRAESSVDVHQRGPTRDAYIITILQKIEHYEIASYGTLRQFADTLGLVDSTIFIGQSLDEEKAMDEILTKVAIMSINNEAALIEIG